MIEKLLTDLGKNLKAAAIDTAPKSYLENAIKYSALILIAFLFIWTLVLENIVLGLFYSAIIFLGSMLFFFYLPIMKKKRIAALIEKDLPFALMSMSVLLNINIPFDLAIESVAKEGYGLLSKELQKISEEIKQSGASIQEALFNFSERVDSLNVKRSVSQLVSIYEQGGKKLAGEPVKRLAIEQFAKQKAVAKEFSGKLVVFSLMFIAISAIVPALFLAFVGVGSMFMLLDFTPLQVLIIAIVGFPLLDLIALLYIKSKTPIFLRE